MKKNSSIYLNILFIFSFLISACVPIKETLVKQSVEVSNSKSDGLAVIPATSSNLEVTETSSSTEETLNGMQLLVGIYKLEKSDLALTADQAKTMLPLWQKFHTLIRSMGPGMGNPPGQNSGGNSQGQGGGNPPNAGQISTQAASSAQGQGGPIQPGQANSNMNPENDTERKELVKQILAVFTPAQVNAIKDMKITQEVLETVLKELGINMKGPQGLGIGNGQGQPGAAQGTNNQSSKGTPPAGGQQPPSQGSGQNNQGDTKPPMMGGGMVNPELVKAVLQILAKKAGVVLPTETAQQTNNQPPSGNQPSSGNQPPSNNNSAPANTVAVYKQSGGTVTKNNQTIPASDKDQSGVNVTDGGTLNLSSSTVTTTGNTSNNDQSSFYGLNAAVLADSASKITLTDTNITTSGSGANGAFATGKGSSVTIVNGTIKTSGGGGHGVMATQGGTITMTNVNMDTQGSNGAPYATDRGGGTITATGGTVTCSGQDSPGIYSTGTIDITDATISSTGAEAAVIEGANNIILKDTQLTSSKDNKWGVMIYQSMSGDAEGARGVFTMTGGSLKLTAASGPLFYITNTTGIITLKGVQVTAQSGTLLKAATGNWGNKGSNGGTVQFTADSQSLDGNFEADSISKIDLTLQNGSTLNGAINPNKQAASVSLTLDASSNWNVTGDSYLNGFTDASGISGNSITNITGNGHTVYYDASLASNSQLGGKTYSLVNGGQLTPKK